MARSGYVKTGLTFSGGRVRGRALLDRRKGKVASAYLLCGRIWTLKQMRDHAAKITGLRAPFMKIPNGLALGVGLCQYGALAAGRGREPGITSRRR